MACEVWFLSYLLSYSSSPLPCVRLPFPPPTELLFTSRNLHFVQNLLFHGFFLLLFSSSSQQPTRLRSPSTPRSLAELSASCPSHPARIPALRQLGRRFFPAAHLSWTGCFTAFCCLLCFYPCFLLPATRSALFLHYNLYQLPACIHVPPLLICNPCSH